MQISVRCPFLITRDHSFHLRLQRVGHAGQETDAFKGISISKYQQPCYCIKSSSIYCLVGLQINELQQVTSIMFGQLRSKAHNARSQSYRHQSAGKGRFRYETVVWSLFSFLFTFSPFSSVPFASSSCQRLPLNW